MPRLTKRALLGSGAAALAFSTRAPAQPLQELVVGISSTSFGTVGARIAKDMGLFARNGVDAKFVVMETGNIATTALLSGSFKAVLGGSGEIVVAAARKQPLVAVANTYGGLAASVVLAKSAADKSGVASDAPVEQRLKALDGLLIGSTAASSTTTVAFRAAAAALGVNLRFTYMSQPQMTAALDAGAVQAFSSSAPFWTMPVIRGTGVRWISGPLRELPPQFLSASAGNMQMLRGFAEANRDLVRRIWAVFEEFGRIVDERPAEVKAQLAKFYPNIPPAFIDSLFVSESNGWKVKALTPADMAKEIEFVRLGGAQLDLEGLDPASMIFP